MARTLNELVENLHSLVSRRQNGSVNLGHMSAWCRRWNRGSTYDDTPANENVVEREGDGHDGQSSETGPSENAISQRSVRNQQC